MSKAKETVITQGELGEVYVDVLKPEVETEIEETETEIEETEVELDWKTAAKRLKKLVADNSIDTYFKKDEINRLRDRYNNKERSEELYNQIMGV